MSGVTSEKKRWENRGLGEQVKGINIRGVSTKKKESQTPIKKLLPKKDITPNLREINP